MSETKMIERRFFKDVIVDTGYVDLGSWEVVDISEEEGTIIFQLNSEEQIEEWREWKEGE